MRDDLLEWLKPSEPIYDIKGEQLSLDGCRFERRRMSSNVDLVIMWQQYPDGCEKRVDSWYERRDNHKRMPL